MAARIPKGHTDSRYGNLGPEGLVQVMRDRIHPVTGEQSDEDTFDNGESLATNGALYQVVFDPEALTFWVAAGATPVPKQPFTAFSLGQLLDMSGHSTPTAIP